MAGSRPPGCVLAGSRAKAADIGDGDTKETNRDLEGDGQLAAHELRYK